jgi:hypothetical protein
MRNRLKHLTLAMALLVLGGVTACRTPEPIPSPIPPQPTPTLLPSRTVTPTRPVADTIEGVVLDADGPVAGAVVRVQATTNQALTDGEGHFTLTGLSEGVAVTVSTWKDNYYCAKVEGVVPPASGIALTLRRYQTNDNPDYEWIPPAGADSCASCKPGVTQIWLDNAHAGAGTNSRFLTMYNGTDVLGNQSPPTRRGYSRDYGSFPLRPDPNQPYYGPGYKLDFPDTAGNCAACHMPGAAVDAAYGTDPNTLIGADTFGVHCDFCHKVAGVTLNPATGLPFPNMPGVLSMDVRRPFPDDPERYQLFFGTFEDDNVPEEDTYLPLIETSQFCAPCHFGVFWDTVVYNSFGEWLKSPYSDPETGQTCQNCHMPSPAVLDGEPMTNVALNKGGVERNPMTIHAHSQPGAMDEELLQDAVALDASAARQDGQIVITVTITNDNTGHHVPTDSPLRHLILLVQATDASGNPLPQLDGSTVPEWGGVGDPAEGYYAGLPGTAYAKILEEVWTEVSPSGAYWNPTRVVSDNRIPALGSDTTNYAFTAPDSAEVAVEVILLFRRAFIELMDQKGWEMPDIVMSRQSVTIYGGK